MLKIHGITHFKDPAYPSISNISLLQPVKIRDQVNRSPFVIIQAYSGSVFSHTNNPVHNIHWFMNVQQNHLSIPSPTTTIPTGKHAKYWTQTRSWYTFLGT